MEMNGKMNRSDSNGTMPRMPFFNDASSFVDIPALFFAQHAHPVLPRFSRSNLFPHY